jgi:fermentation-respiration switch protein FrsA (DUF1100 family)
MMLTLGRTAALLCAAYGCYALLLFFCQRALIYPGRTIRVPAAPAASAGLERFWLASPAGRTEAWFLPATVGRGPQPAVLFFHGNGEVIDDLPGQVGGLRQYGLHLLLVEYPGYGRSNGTPSEGSISAVAMAAYDALAGRPDVDRSRILAIGRSLGGGAACLLSRQRPLAAMVLQSAFSSTRPFARQFLVPGFLVRDVYDNLAAVRDFPGPILVAHGTRDDIIPFRHGQELVAAARQGRLLALNCAHNDCPPDDAAFWQEIGGFLDQHGIIPRR